MLYLCTIILFCLCYILHVKTYRGEVHVKLINEHMVVNGIHGQRISEITTLSQLTEVPLKVKYRL